MYTNGVPRGRAAVGVLQAGPGTRSVNTTAGRSHGDMCFDMSICVEGWRKRCMCVQIQLSGQLGLLACIISLPRHIRFTYTYMQSILC
jgi:hypothetical protein